MSRSAREKIGALIVVERETGLQDAAETGIMLDAELSVELLETIFTPHSPLHDGAVIVRHERVVSAGVVLPLSETGVYRERFGTRHRAALGITEQTDAVAVVVSEETGAVSLVERGRIVRDLDEQRLVQHWSTCWSTRSWPRARIPARATCLRRRCHRPQAVRRRRGRRHGRGQRPQPRTSTMHASAATPAAGQRAHAAATPRPSRVRRVADFLRQQLAAQAGSDPARHRPVQRPGARPERAHLDRRVPSRRSATGRRDAHQRLEPVTADSLPGAARRRRARRPTHSSPPSTCRDVEAAARRPAGPGAHQPHRARPARPDRGFRAARGPGPARSGQ